MTISRQNSCKAVEMKNNEKKILVDEFFHAL
jgi:hypothetical protein